MKSIKYILIIASFFFVKNGYCQGSVKLYISDILQQELRMTMERNASLFLTELNKAWSDKTDINLSEGIILSSFEDKLSKMWESAPFYIPEEIIIQPVFKQQDGSYSIRNIPVYFISKEGQIYEECVIKFSPSGLIEELKIGLPVHQYQSLIKESKDSIDSINREMILSFIETFRTSYNQKDIKFIQTVFSDEALIIVGRVIETTGEGSAFEQQVEYLQFNKGDYIARLRTIFNANEWINVVFEDIRIDRHPKYPFMYGVYLTQYYSSSLYSDTGYLFLMIDFRDEDVPVIHVRTWEPKNQITENERFEMGLIEIF